MLVSSSLLSFLLLSISLSAQAIQPLDAPVSLPLTKRLNLGSLKNLVQRDRLRAKTLRARAETILSGNLPVSMSLRDEIPAEVTNSVVSYTAAVGVGSPPTTYNLLVDTGSSNTWVGANTSYVVTFTSVPTKDNVSVAYGSGSFSGSEYLDTVTLSPDLVLNQQSIGVASSSQGLDENDGILGIGPTDLTLGTLSPDTQATIPTVVDTAAAQGLITANAVGVYFEPITSSSQGAGELSYGGANKEKYIGEMTFAPLTTTAPAKLYWGIDQTIMYGAHEILGSAGIVDTGSTLMLIATDAFQKYQSLTGAVMDNNTGLLRITPAQFAKLQPLEFIIQGRPFILTRDAQLWPRSLNTQIGGVANELYLIVADLGSPSGSGLDFINGYTFLERFYTLYDTDNQRMGFAETFYTYISDN